MELKNIKKIYIIGIEGAGTSALAQMFKSRGIEVSGSDEGDHYYYDMLKNQDIQVFHKFDKSNISDDVDLIIYSIAFKFGSNVEMVEAKASGRAFLSYGQALGLIFNNSFGISICGTHGKTSTSAWLAYVCQKFGLDPSMIVGAKIPQFDSNSILGKSDYFILESDEYGNKLQYLMPQAVILNNIDYDHPDYFANESDYLQVFIDFIKKIPKKGFLLANYDDPNVRKIIHVNTRAKIITFALSESADYVAYDLKIKNKKQFFKVKIFVDGDNSLENALLGDFSISLCGRHNVYNALAVIAASIELDIPLVEIRTHLETFHGAARRMEQLGKYKGALVFDDYAHHPTEIKASLRALRNIYPDKKLIVVFHPHTFTRTKAFLNSFCQSFSLADELIILDIYGSAREKQGGVHALDLLKLIKENEPDKKAKYIPSLMECEAYLSQSIGSGDLLLLMGAGDVYKIGQNLVSDY